ncbi:hypothetical protein CEXT_64211 [Caerostris extrusa]|uniref:Uncharacterized protein n=1 Tax=Caerostris extrusa TaxID=172846 RepID=A0AAV4Q6B9_CAEEX|nr:hypothetical protein CEXT_64211 [Caerostris extrusa]
MKIPEEGLLGDTRLPPTLQMELYKKLCHSSIINKFTGEKIKRQEGKLSLEIKADILALEDGLLEKDVSHQVPVPIGEREHSI